MTVQEVKDEKQRLESNILDLIEDFEKKTSTKIEAIDITRSGEDIIYIWIKCTV